MSAMYLFQRELDTFKETFQKGSQIYKFLREHWKKSPLFLDRTLSFISETRRRPIRKRETSIDKVAKRLKTLGPSTTTLPIPRLVPRKVLASEYDVSETVAVYINWICNNDAKTTQKTKSYGFFCPWCEKDYHSLACMMLHLKCSHPRFNVVVHPQPLDSPCPVIDMTLNLSYDGSYCGFKYPGHDLRRDFKFVNRDHPKQPTTQHFHFKGLTRPNQRRHQDKKRKISAVSLDKFSFGNNEEEADVDVCSGRLYYHTSTCLPIKPNEVDVDSEADIDPEWLRERTQLMIEEFTDVNEGEKEILKLWNLHIMKNYKYKGDGMMRRACLDFVDLEGQNVIAKNLSRNFILHLANLFDFGLISSRDVLECTRKLRKLKLPQISSPQKMPVKIIVERNSERPPHTPAKRACLLNSNCNQ